MAAKSLLALLLGLAAATGQPSCSPGDACLGDEAAEDGSLIQKRMQDANVATAAKAAKCVKSTGQRTTEDGELKDFSAVDVSGMDNRVIFQTGSESSYSADVDSAVADKLSVGVSRGTLKVELKATCVDDRDWSKRLAIVNVTAPEFPTKIAASGQGGFENIGGSETVDTLIVTASGQAGVNLQDVTADTCTFTVEGQGSIRGATCETLKVKGGGQGSIGVKLTGSATGSMSGQASLQTTGSGSTSGVTISGQASVNR